MTEYTRQHSNDDKAPPTDPAPQPTPPGGECKDLPESTPPTLQPPKRCPEPPCKCPTTTGTSTNCLEDLITKQAAEIAGADKAKAFKADLEAVLSNARAAAQDYTRDKYEKLRKQWVDQDADIADLVRKVVCALPCWRCIIECHVCTLINELHYAERRLYGDGTLYAEVHDLQDLLYWHTRDRDAKERHFLRIKTVLAAWEKPAATIDKNLADGAKIIADVGKSLGSAAPKAAYDVFLRLVPMHLAIAPPRGSAWTTKIDREYIEFCACDTGEPDDCCGPDVGVWSFRQRLIGPQPYLVDPNDYFGIICCLVEKRYAPAREALARAEADLVTVDNQIKRARAQIEDGLKSFERDAKAAIPAVVDCADYEEISEGEPIPKQSQSQPRAR